MSEWRPRVPEVDGACDGCGRGLPTYLRSREETMAVSLAPLPRFDGATAQEWLFCGDCAAEVTELTDSMTAAGEPPISHADLLAAPDCGVCGDDIDHPRRVLTPRWRGGREGAAPRYPLCGSCDAVIAEFLGNVPGEEPAGEVYYGERPDVRVSLSEADAESLLATFEALRPGTELRVESHAPATESEPAGYHVVEATVAERYAPHGIEEVVLDAGDGRYRLVRPAPTVDALTLGEETPGGWRDCGRATVLSVESWPALAAAAEADDEAPLAEVDSALVPDGLDALGNSD